MPSKEDILAMWITLLRDVWNIEMTDREFEERFAAIEKIEAEFECTEKSKPKT